MPPKSRPAPIGHLVHWSVLMLAHAINRAEARLLEFDHRSHELFEDYGDTAPVKALDLFSKLGDQPQVRAVSIMVFVAGIFARSEKLVRAGARMLIAHEAATFAKSRVKSEIDRTRPRSASSRAEKKLKKGPHQAKELTSFPSGHSAGAIAAARAFSREFPEYGPAAIGAATVIAASQVPRCAHYPTDVAAGLAVGLAAEKAVDVVWDVSLTLLGSQRPGD